MEKGSGKCMYKIAVIGDYDSIYGFAALGLETFPVNGVEETEKLFHQLASGEYAVIYITEAAAAGIGHTIEKYKESLLPSVILIPGISGNTGKGIEGVKKSVEQAVGSDILFGGM